MILGNPAIIADGRLNTHRVNYALVPLSEPIGSIGEDGGWNPAYPEAMRRTDMGDAKDIRRVNEWGAKNLQPGMLLTDGPVAHLGPPTMGPDGIVDGGSRRLDMLRLAKATGGYESYKAALRNSGDRFGFSRDQVDSVEDPVVVRARRDPMSPGVRARFARALNTDPDTIRREYESSVRVGLQMAGVMKDIARASRMDTASLFENPTVSRLIASQLPALDPEDVAGMIDPSSLSLTGIGKRRIMAGILSTVVSDPRLVADFLEP